MERERRGMQRVSLFLIALHYPYKVERVVDLKVILFVEANAMP